MFLELSRFFFDGSSELLLANFLHMLTIMAQSGSTDEEIDLFVLKSQMIPNLPDDEPLWSLSSEASPSIPAPSADLECGPSKPSRRKPAMAGCWPPTDWKTAPDFEYSRRRNLRTRAYDCSHDGSGTAAGNAAQIEPPISVEIPGNWLLEEASVQASTSAPQDLELAHCQSSSAAQNDPAEPCVGRTSQPANSLDLERIGRPNSDELLRRMTGRHGEMLAFMYFTQKFVTADVRWVNEEAESGLPYDLVVGGSESRQYIEVKATKSASKAWFDISMREWQFAVEMGDSYSIAHVAITGDKANITVLRNPCNLIRQNALSLALMMPKR